MKLEMIVTIVEEMKKANRFFISKNQIYEMTEPCTYAIIPANDETLWVTKNVPEKYIDDLDEVDVGKILKRLKRDPQLQKDLEAELKKSEYFLNLRNGVFDLKEKKLTKRGDLIFTYILDFEYLPNSKIEDAPAIQNYLETSLDYPESQEKAKSLFEIIGTCISSVTDHRHWYLLTGPTRCGKSVIALLIARVIKPSHLVQALSLHRLANRFDPEHLITAKLNISSEINAEKIKDTGILKQIVSEEPIFVEQKSKCGYTATSHCKLLCASNQMPAFGNLDASGNEALYDRMIILRYKHGIPPENDDKELGEKLYECRNVWGSLAVDALVELVQNGFQFTESEDAKELRRIAQQEDLSLRLFIEQECQFEGRVHRCTILEAYNVFCKQNGFRPYKPREVLNFVSANYPSVANDKIKIAGSYRWGWTGLSLKEEKKHE